MPANKRTITLPDGRQVEGTLMPFQTGQENWNEYLVDDGSVVRIKLVATEVLRIDGEWDQNGNPLYLVGSTNLSVVTSPDNLKRKEG